jgi:hypothetical protein
MPISEDIVRYVRRLASPVLGGTAPDFAELAVDKTTNTLKYHSNGTHEAVTLDLTQAITGDKTLSGTTSFTGATAGVRRAVSVTAANTIAITAAMSGTVFVATKASATQVFTLPAAATAGLEYTFVCGTAGLDGEIHVGVFAGDLITGKIHAAENGTALLSTVTTGLLKNTAGTNVDGDFCTLVSDGVTTWYMISLAGVWSAT